MSKYCLTPETGTLHRPNCYYVPPKYTIVDYLPEIGELVITGTSVKTFTRSSYIRAYDGAFIKEATVTKTHTHTQKVQRYCSCLSKHKDIVPIGKRICRGPLHPQGKLMRTTEFHRSSRGRLRAICRDCVGHNANRPHGVHGYIPKEKVMPYLDKLVETHGLLKTAKRLNLTPEAIRYTRKTARAVRKSTARSILLEFQALEKAA